MQNAADHQPVRLDGVEDHVRLETVSEQAGPPISLASKFRHGGETLHRIVEVLEVAVSLPWPERFECVVVDRIDVGFGGRRKLVVSHRYGAEPLLWHVQPPG